MNELYVQCADNDKIYNACINIKHEVCFLYKLFADLVLIIILKWIQIQVNELLLIFLIFLK